VYQHRVGTPAATDVVIGRGTDATFVAATVPGVRSGHVQSYGSASNTVTLSQPNASGATVASIASPNVPLTSLDDGDRRYLQVDRDVVAVAGGRVVATYPLPLLHADPTAGRLPAGYKGMFDGTGYGDVTALVPAANGDILAFTATGLAAAVTDLTTGHTVLLRGYGSLAGAVRTARGDLLVLGWRANDAAFPMTVLSLDGTSMRPVAAMSTGLAPASYLRADLALGTGPDAVVGIARGDNTSGVTLSLFTVTGTRLTAGPDLPVNAGLEIAAAGPGTLYVFNGPAGNTVGELTLAGGVLRPDIRSLRTSAGSYVLGIDTAQ
jgi:hypothetical protein